MSRIQQTFQNLDGKKALIPFITVGDPNLETTLKLMHVLADNGADIIELGVPFSDPMADGKVIQKATERALKNQVSIQDVLKVVQQFRQKNKTTPIVLMGYLNPIYHMGYEKFCDAAKQAGVDGVLTVDCPEDYIDELQAALKMNELDCIFLIAPTTTPVRINEIAQKASGFIYYVSLKGVTGSSQLDVEAVSSKIEQIKLHTNLPIAVGFGIKNATTAHTVAQYAEGVVVGSAIVEIVEQYADSSCDYVGSAIAEFKAAIQF